MIVVTLCILTLSLQQPWRAVDSALGRTGSLQGETYRVGFPRNDLHVTVGAVTVRPALAMLMGDLVLLESEVGPSSMRSNAAVSSRRHCTITWSAKRRT